MTGHKNYPNSRGVVKEGECDKCFTKDVKGRNDGT